MPYIPDNCNCTLNPIKHGHWKGCPSHRRKRISPEEFANFLATATEVKAFAELENIVERLSQAEAALDMALTRCNQLESAVGGATLLEDSERDISISRFGKTAAWSAFFGDKLIKKSSIFLTWMAAWKAAEQAAKGAENAD